MEIGTKIRINNGKVEVLIKKDGNLGLFKSRKYQVVRKILSIMSKEILTWNHFSQISKFENLR